MEKSYSNFPLKGQDKLRPELTKTKGRANSVTGVFPSKITKNSRNIPMPNYSEADKEKSCQSLTTYNLANACYNSQPTRRRGVFNFSTGAWARICPEVKFQGVKTDLPSLTEHFYKRETGLFPSRRQSSGNSSTMFKIASSASLLKLHFPCLSHYSTTWLYNGIQCFKVDYF